MPATTIRFPDHDYEYLRERAHAQRTSINQLVLDAVNLDRRLAIQAAADGEQNKVFYTREAVFDMLHSNMETYRHQHMSVHDLIGILLTQAAHLDVVETKWAPNYLTGRPADFAWGRR